MLRKCSVCEHEDLAEIDSALASNEPLRAIAHRWSVTKMDLIRHRNQHLPVSAMKAKEAGEVAHDEARRAKEVAHDEGRLTKEVAPDKVMFAKVGNYYFNLNNVAYVSDNGDHIIVRFNFVNPSTQGLQAVRVGGNEAKELRARLDELTL
jgi:hypothetical protein